MCGCNGGAVVVLEGACGAAMGCSGCGGEGVRL